MPPPARLASTKCDEDREAAPGLDVVVTCTPSKPPGFRVHVPSYSPPVLRAPAVPPDPPELPPGAIAWGHLACLVTLAAHNRALPSRPAPYAPVTPTVHVAARCTYCCQRSLPPRTLAGAWIAASRCASCGGPLPTQPCTLDAPAVPPPPPPPTAPGALAPPPPSPVLDSHTAPAEEQRAAARNGEACDPHYLHTYCNGHGRVDDNGTFRYNGWMHVQCPCMCLWDAGIALPSPSWLHGRSLDPHDHANCADAYTGHADLYADEPAADVLRARAALPGSTGSAHGDLARDLERMQDALDCECVASDDTSYRLAERRTRLNWWRVHPKFRSRTRHGFRQPWTEVPPPYERKPDPNYASAHCGGVYTEMKRLRELNLVQGPFRVSDCVNVVVVVPIGSVPKKNSTKLRVVIDFTESGNNSRLPARPMFLPTVRDAVDFVTQPDYFAAKIDLKDAFFSHGLHPHSRPWSALADPTPLHLRDYDPGDDPDDEARYWAYNVTAFGGSLHPWVFCSQLEHTIKFLRDKWGLQILCFVDDAIVCGKSPARVAAGLRMLRSALNWLGYREAPSKFEPCSRIWSWLGLEFDTRAGHMKIRYPPDKRDSLLADLRAFRHAHSAPGARVSRKTLSSLVGRVSFASAAIRNGRTYTRRLYQSLHRHASHLTIHQRIHMLGTTVLDADFFDDLDWWISTLPSCPGVSLHTPDLPRFKIFGDASSFGRGCSLYHPDGTRSFSWPWDIEMQNASSNLRELHTFLDALLLWQPLFPAGSTILYTSDNMTTVKCINSASAVSDQLLHLTRRIHSFAALHDLNVLSRWAPGLTLIAEGSDDLSRSGRFAPKDRTAWQLSPALLRHWSTVMPDTPLILPDFHSVGPVLRDALLAFEHSSAPAAFVVPYWPQASWMPLLKRFTIAHEYAVGLPVLRHPDRPAVAVNSRHPLVVVRLVPCGSSTALRFTKAQPRPLRSLARPVNVRYLGVTRASHRPLCYFLWLEHC